MLRSFAYDGSTHAILVTNQDGDGNIRLPLDIIHYVPAMSARAHRQSFASVSCHRDVIASLAVSHADDDFEFEWIAFAGSLNLDHSLPSP